MKINKIKETCLYVKDLKATRQFYQERLGLEVIGEVEDRHVFFRAGSSVLLCFNAEATKLDKVLPPHFGSGQNHLAFEVNREEYEEWKKKMTIEDIKIIHEQEWKGGLQSFYFHDPDGHLLEIVQEGMWE
jgi:catechol 2,3-dioxygenase-like lactoylglutathione lyase family enzyme